MFNDMPECQLQSASLDMDISVQFFGKLQQKYVVQAIQRHAGVPDA